MSLTLEQLQNQVTVTLDPLAQFTAPVLSTPAMATYTPVNIEELITNEALNRGSETLKTSVNEILANLITQLNLVIGTVTTDINATIAADWTNLQRLQNAINDAEFKLANLNDVLETDADFLNNITQINTLITQLNTMGGSTVTSLNSVISAINALPLLIRKNVAVNTTNGIYNYSYGSENIPAGGYLISANIVNAPTCQVDVRNVTTNGFELYVRSNGIHFVPQPVNCSVTPVNVVVTLTKERQEIPVVPPVTP